MMNWSKPELTQLFQTKVEEAIPLYPMAETGAALGRLSSTPFLDRQSHGISLVN